MRAISLLLLALCLLAASCSDGDRPTVTNDPLATARPAPTVGGEATQRAEAAVDAQAVVVGADAQSLIELRAQPGTDLPLVGEVPAGTVLQPMGQMFTTEDGLLWWQIRAGDIQGWTSANIAYLGPAEVNTFEGNASYDSPAEAAAVVTDQIAAARAATEVTIISATEIVDQGSATITSDLVLGDARIAGLRLVVAIKAVGDEADTWRPVTLTQFELCSNGVNAQGACL